MKCYKCFYRWDKSESTVICNHPKSEHRGFDVEIHADKVKDCKLYNRGIGKDCKHRKGHKRDWNKNTVYRCWRWDKQSYRCGADALCFSRTPNGYGFDLRRHRNEQDR